MEPTKSLGLVAGGEIQPVSLLVVTNRLDLGGTEKHLLTVLPRLAERGFNIQVATLQAGGSLTPAFKAAGVPVLEPPRSGRLGWVAWLRRLYRRMRPDLIYLLLPEAYLLGRLAGLGLTVRWAMGRRSLNNYQAKYPLAAWVERRLHHRMHALIGNSAAVLADLKAEGAPSGRLHMIRNALTTIADGDGAAARSRLQLAPDELVLTIVASLHPYKGHADLLHALADIAPRLPQHWRLLCAGKDMGAQADLLTLAGNLGLSGQVHWLGERNDIADLLLASDIVVSASHEEGSSNAVLEAMAAGCAVVASRAGGNAEVIVDGADGLLVPVGDAPALGGALLRLAADAPLRHRLGAAARDKVRAGYSVTACVAAYEHLMRGLLEPGPRQ